MQFSFHAKISQCVCSLWFYFLFLCWYLAFFNQLIIIVLCSFDSRQFPEINGKKKTHTTVVPKTWRVMHCGPLPVSRSGAAENDSDRRKPSTARMIRPIALAHPFSITPMSSFIVLKVVSFPFKWRPERRCSLLPFTYRSLCKCIARCSPMQQETEGGKRSLKGVRSLRGEWRKPALAPPHSPFVWSRAFVRARVQMRFCTSSIWPGYEPLNGCSTCSRGPLLHRPYFVQMGLHRAGH